MSQDHGECRQVLVRGQPTTSLCAVVVSLTITTLTAAPPTQSASSIVAPACPTAFELISIDYLHEHSGNGESKYPRVSADGNRVAFVSSASNLLPTGPFSLCNDLFLYDRTTQEMELVSRQSPPLGVDPNGCVQFPRISPNGRFVAYATDSPYVLGEEQGTWTLQVYLYDSWLKTTVRASRPDPDSQSTIPWGNNHSNYPVPTDGGNVYFISTATNLTELTGYHGSNVFLFTGSLSGHSVELVSWPRESSYGRATRVEPAGDSFFAFGWNAGSDPTDPALENVTPWGNIYFAAAPSGVPGGTAHVLSAPAGLSTEAFSFDGSTVVFATDAQLSPVDTDNSFNIYVSGTSVAATALIMNPENHPSGGDYNWTVAGEYVLWWTQDNLLGTGDGIFRRRVPGWDPVNTPPAEWPASLERIVAAAPFFTVDADGELLAFASNSALVPPDQDQCSELQCKDIFVLDPKLVQGFDPPPSPIPGSCTDAILGFEPLLAGNPWTHPLTDPTSPSAIVTDVNYLAEATPPRAQGLVSDGVARIVLRVQTAQPGIVYLSIVSGINDVGLLSRLDQDRSAGARQIYLDTVTVSSGRHYAFAVLWAPDEFVRFNHASDLERAYRFVEVSADFYDDLKGPIRGTSVRQLRIERPPVALIHGVWSSGATWDHPILTDSRWQTNTPSYPPDIHLLDNWPNVQRALLETLQLAYLRGLAAGKVDVAAHSMGAILTRMVVDNTSAIGPGPFPGTGLVRRFSLLDSPQYGSDSGDFLFELLYQLAIADRSVEYELTRVLCNIGKCVYAGAAEDMRTTSPVLAWPEETEVMAHVNVGSGGETYIRSGCVPPLSPLLNVLVAFFGQTALDWIYGWTDHDVAVPVWSQLAGLSPADDAVSMFGFDSCDAPGIHSKNTCCDVRYGQALEQQFNLRANQIAFSNLPPRANPPVARSSSLASSSNLTLAGTGSIRIAAPLPGAPPAAPGQVLTVVLAAEGGFEIDRALVLVDAAVALIETGLTATVEVPGDALGTVFISAYAFNSSDEMAIAEPVELQVESPGALEALGLAPYQTIVDGAAQIEYEVLGTFENGRTVNLEGGGTDAVLSASPPCTAAVIGRDRVVGLSRGWAAITASSASASGTGAVFVRSDAGAEVTLAGDSFASEFREVPLWGLRTEIGQWPWKAVGLVRSGDETARLIEGEREGEGRVHYRVPDCGDFPMTDVSVTFQPAGVTDRLRLAFASDAGRLFSGALFGVELQEENGQVRFKVFESGQPSPALEGLRPAAPHYRTTVVLNRGEESLQIVLNDEVLGVVALADPGLIQQVETIGFGLQGDPGVHCIRHPCTGSADDFRVMLRQQL